MLPRKKKPALEVVTTSPTQAPTELARQLEASLIQHGVTRAEINQSLSAVDGIGLSQPSGRGKVSPVIRFDLDARNDTPHWGHGHHYWTAIKKCGARHTLSRLARARGEAAGPALDVGKMFHAHLELYYQEHAFDPTDVEFVGRYREEERIEADRLARWYMSEFPAYELGEVLATEHFLPKLEDTEAQARVLENFGIDYCAVLDLIVKVTARDAERLKTTRRIDIEPGIWLVDHKTESRDDFQDRLRHDRQFTGNILLWDLVHPETPCQGLLANVVVKTKTPSTRTIVIPQPDQTEIDGFLDGITRAKWLQQNDPYFVDDTECFPWIGRPCQFWLNGACDRSRHTSERLRAMAEEG